MEESNEKSERLQQQGGTMSELTEKSLRNPERSLDELLDFLSLCGCFPSLSKRCKDRRRAYAWRFHVNWSGNYWADGQTPAVAARRAIAAWDRDGRPMDGAASEESEVMR